MNPNSCKAKKHLTVNEMMAKGREILKAYQKEDANIDARLLAMHLLECSGAELLLNANEEVADHIVESYMYMVAKRSQGKPLQYITKNQEFMGLDFYVDERVLIPRQDTEILVEAIIARSKNKGLKKALEIGVGSGCISISLLHYLKGLEMVGVDICEDALEVAKRNATDNAVDERFSLIQSDVFTNYKGQEESLDLIVSNPPYITKEECKTLMVEVRSYEPLKALTDGGDGLYFYRTITAQGKKYLKPNGLIVYEIGYLQAKDVCDILKDEGFEEIEVIKDLQGHDRVVIAKRV